MPLRPRINLSTLLLLSIMATGVSLAQAHFSSGLITVVPAVIVVIVSLARGRAEWHGLIVAALCVAIVVIGSTLDSRGWMLIGPMMILWLWSTWRSWTPASDARAYSTTRCLLAVVLPLFSMLALVLLLYRSTYCERRSPIWLAWPAGAVTLAMMLVPLRASATRRSPLRAILAAILFAASLVLAIAGSFYSWGCAELAAIEKRQKNVSEASRWLNSSLHDDVAKFMGWRLKEESISWSRDGDRDLDGTQEAMTIHEMLIERRRVHILLDSTEWSFNVPGLMIPDLRDQAIIDHDEYYVLAFSLSTDGVLETERWPIAQLPPTIEAARIALIDFWVSGGLALTQSQIDFREGYLIHVLWPRIQGVTGDIAMLHHGEDGWSYQASPWSGLDRIPSTEEVQQWVRRLGLHDR